LGTKYIGKQSIRFDNPPSIVASAAVGSKKEGDGPLGSWFDYISADSRFGQKSWEKAETTMQQKVFSIACDKAMLSPSQLRYIFAGDLLNQCTASSYSMRDSGIPFLGLYGACSTIAQGLALAAMSIDGGYADKAAVITSSHFCSAERQFRTPLEYGGQRTPTAQWTATAAGCAVLSAVGQGPFITNVTIGTIKDAGISDVNNMGAAMAPAAYETISTHLADFSIKPGDYDLIVTGDLGKVGHDILLDLFSRDGFDLSAICDDCGLLLYSLEEQDVHAGASGCGCAASVLCGYLLAGVRSGRWKKVLISATGALMSPVTSGQGESIPGISHAVTICSSGEGF